MSFSLFSSSTLTSMARRKVVDNSHHDANALPRKLGAFDLVLYGVGSSVGAGIYVLVGLGARVAGPAISISFLLCGWACILTSLSYADFAARIPITGSAFTYAYVAFGEFWAWIVGWNLILGFGFTTSVVARAWGDYVGGFVGMYDSSAHGSYDENIYSFTNIGHTIMSFIVSTISNLAAFQPFGDSWNYTCSPISALLVGVNTLILLRGVEDSSMFTNVMTTLNVSVLLLVIAAGWLSGSVHVEDNLLTPAFMPNGFGSVVHGAGLVFFAFIGFDMVASLSEEVVNPGYNMPIGIVGSLLVSSTLYVIVTLTVIGMAPIDLLGIKVPIVNALMANAHCTHEEQVMLEDTTTALLSCIQGDQGHIKNIPYLAVIARIVSAGAILGLMASSFTSHMGQPRIFYRMSLDGLWFPLFAKLDPVTRVPREGTIITGIVAALLACFAPLDALASLISLGTLMVFTFVNGGVILLKLRNIQHSIFYSDSDDESESVDAKGKKGAPDTAFIEARIGTVLIIYTASATIASMVYTISDGSYHYTLLAFFSMTIMILSAIYVILYVPYSHKSEPVDHFECPLVPFIPLAGIACNCFMMGSLPLTSWLLCSVWLLIGMCVYFTYGIHHSALAVDNSETELAASEESPLLASNSSKGKYTGQDGETTI